MYMLYENIENGKSFEMLYGFYFLIFNIIGDLVLTEYLKFKYVFEISVFYLK